MSDAVDVDGQIARSWIDNAAAWTQAVRDGLSPSRGAGTNAAIVAACSAFRDGPVLDVGCGEGWLVRALATRAGPLSMLFHCEAM